MPNARAPGTRFAIRPGGITVDPWSGSGCSMKMGGPIVRSIMILMSDVGIYANPPAVPVADFRGPRPDGPLEVRFRIPLTGDRTYGTLGRGDKRTYPQVRVRHPVTGPRGSDTHTRQTISGDGHNSYTLTVNLVGEGSVTLDPDGGTYDAGTEVQLTPVPMRVGRFMAGAAI